MAGIDTLAKALTDVRQRKNDLQIQHERIGAELNKLRMAEASLASIVDGTPLLEAPFIQNDSVESFESDKLKSGRSGKRGARGPRANSAKGRLRNLIDGAGPQGLTQAEIARRLPDVSPATLNAYLSGMVSGGDAIRAGDFFKPGMASGSEESVDTNHSMPNHNDMKDAVAD